MHKDSPNAVLRFCYLRGIPRYEDKFVHKETLQITDNDASTVGL